MKSSTLRRSNIKKKKMAVLEALANYKTDSSYDESPNVYVRPNKEKELDLLWQNFKISQKSEKSPGVYLATGFIAGAITMLLVSSIINVSIKSDKAAVKQTTAAATTVSKAKTQTYVVQSGDTIENISLKFYGTYNPAKVRAIQQASNLSNVNKLQIGQTLTIPME